MRSFLLMIVISTLPLLAGCGEDDTTKPPDPPYSGPATPAELIEVLAVSYRQHAIDLYASLLAPEFIFRFHEDSITPEIPLGFWNRSEDSTGTHALFASAEVFDIRIDLTATVPETLIAPEPGDTAVGVRVFANLDVDLDNQNLTLRLEQSPQDFYLRRGRAHDGEDPDRWFLYEWVDREGLGKPGFEPQIEFISWSGIKLRFFR